MYLFKDFQASLTPYLLCCCEHLFALELTLDQRDIHFYRIYILVKPRFINNSSCIFLLKMLIYAGFTNIFSDFEMTFIVHITGFDAQMFAFISIWIMVNSALNLTYSLTYLHDIKLTFKSM